MTKYQKRGLCFLIAGVGVLAFSYQWALNIHGSPIQEWFLAASIGGFLSGAVFSVIGIVMVCVAEF